MADYTPARLRIGGEITAEQYETIQRLAEDATEVLEGHGYEIWRAQAQGGQFAALEAFLTEQGIAFDRYSEPALGYDGRLVHFRPGMTEPVKFPAHGDNPERVAPIGALQSCLTACQRDGLPRAELVARLRALCGPDIAPLLPFRVRLPGPRG